MAEFTSQTLSVKKQRGIFLIFSFSGFGSRQCFSSLPVFHRSGWQGCFSLLIKSWRRGDGCDAHIRTLRFFWLVGKKGPETHQLWQRTFAGIQTGMRVCQFDHSVCHSRARGFIWGWLYDRHRRQLRNQRNVSGEVSVDVWIDPGTKERVCVCVCVEHSRGYFITFCEWGCSHHGYSYLHIEGGCLELALLKM